VSKFSQKQTLQQAYTGKRLSVSQREEI
jgi:hypothetical protein